MTLRISVIVAVCVLIVSGFGSLAFAKNPLKDFGFRALYPPQSKVRPGDLVEVSLGREYSANIRVVCRSDAAFNGARIEIREAASFGITQDSRINAKIGAAFIGRLTGFLRIRHVKQIEFDLRNLSVHELTDAEAFEGVKKRSHSCEQARIWKIERLKNQRKDNRKEYMSVVKQVLVGDAVVKVTWATGSGLSVQQKSATLNQIAGTLGGGFSVGSGMVLSGTGMVWGIFEDQSFATLAPKNAETIFGLYETARSASLSTYEHFMEHQLLVQESDGRAEPMTRVPLPAIPEDFIAVVEVDSDETDKAESASDRSEPPLF